MPWEKISGQVSNREFASSIVFQNKLYVAMGRRSGVYLNDMYSTQNGKDWKNNGPMRDLDGNSMAGRFSYGLCENNNKVYLMGGYKGVGDYLNDVYVTSDMKNWKRLQDAPWSKRYAFAALSFDNKIWVLGGRDASGNLNEVWWTNNGAKWNQEPNASWAARRLHSAFVYNKRLHIVGGYASSYRNDIYNINNDKVWKKVSSNLIFSERRAFAVDIINGTKIVLSGGRTTTSYSNELWYSIDGFSWKLGDPIPVNNINGHSMNYFNKKLVIVGGINGSGVYNGDILVATGQFTKNIV